MPAQLFFRILKYLALITPRCKANRCEQHTDYCALNVMIFAPKRYICRMEKIKITEAQYAEQPRIIVAGGRDFTDYNLLCSVLNEYLAGMGDVKIISGMAEGADSLAIRYADEHSLSKILFPANWKRYPRRAGFLRNADMLSVATHLIAFWDGTSHGTRHIIDIARTKGIPVKVIGY